MLAVRHRAPLLVQSVAHRSLPLPSPLACGSLKGVNLASREYRSRFTQKAICRDTSLVEESLDGVSATLRKGTRYPADEIGALHGNCCAARHLGVPWATCPQDTAKDTDGEGATSPQACGLQLRRALIGADDKHRLGKPLTGDHAQ